MTKGKAVKSLAIFVVAAAMMLLPVFAAAQMFGGGGGGDKGMSPEMQEAAGKMMTEFNKMLQHRFTPVISDVKVGNAVSGKPISISFKAAYDDKRAVDKVVEADVYYSVDGGAAFMGPVKLKQGAGGVWAGQIPPISKKGKVIFYPWVKDSNGNVSLHIPCDVSKWPPFEDGCMAPGAVDREPVDDPKSLIEDNFDLWELYVGMDSKYIYIDQNVEGKISKGTMNPVHINAYLALLMDTKELYDFSDISVFMQQGSQDKYKDKADKAAMIMYAPLASKAAASATAAAGSKEPDKGAEPGKDADAARGTEPPKSEPVIIPSCAVPRVGPDGKPFLDGKSITCKADANDLFIRLDRSVLAASMKNDFTLIGAITGFIKSFDMPIPVFRDIAGFTRIVVQPHSFVVK